MIVKLSGSYYISALRDEVVLNRFNCYLLHYDVLVPFFSQGRVVTKDAKATLIDTRARYSHALKRWVVKVPWYPIYLLVCG